MKLTRGERGSPGVGRAFARLLELAASLSRRAQLMRVLDAEEAFVENPILFCNIGWMTEYRGITKSDKIVGGGSYVKIEQRGHEVCNFAPANGMVYGYVQPRGSQIRIERIGAAAEDEEISGVDVVFTARRPGRGGTVIVGWYRDATVYRHSQRKQWLSDTHQRNGVDAYWISAKKGNVTLLSLDRRNMVVPRGVGGMGQSNVWYADADGASDWVARVRDLISGRTIVRNPRPPRAADPLKKAQVEKAAITAVTSHYQDLGYEVVSVEQECLGWDLEAAEGGIKLLLEVKGLSGSEPVAELTPNEYKQMSGQYKADFRLCVVTNALTGPSLAIFSFNHVSEEWVSEEGGMVLNIREKVGAIVSASNNSLQARRP